ncbi:MAG: hypothetical protein OIN88_00060 [Candidatus Methanoperedens sp.]|nr:hypothetical protein [Candidatus Methanoperedens sp.]MCZ7361681.1 hypothetical protein [Candidatus Methanoperedens sp.]HLB71897.1 hypothetical protein [Candidatus Methanoperedens sp.]
MNIELNGRRTAILLVLASILSGAYAHKQFTNKSIEGTWGFSGSGTIIGVGPAVAVGLSTFDGNGGCSLKEDFNSPSGLETLTSVACTYKVNPDGTGTSTATFRPPLASSTISFVILNEGSEIQAITIDPGVIASLVFKRQSEDS